MPHLATSRSPQALAQAVKLHHQRFRFLVAVSAPAVIRSGHTDSVGEPVIHLYGSLTSCTDALIEATTEHPGCDRVGEYEYLPNALIAQIVRQNLAEDPVAGAMHSLGLVKPDGTPLQ